MRWSLIVLGNEVILVLATCGINHPCNIIKMGHVSDCWLGDDKWSVLLLVGSGTKNVQFWRIQNLLNCNTWVFSVPCAFIVSIHLPMKVKRSFIAKIELFSETVFIKCCFILVQN